MEIKILKIDKKKIKLIFFINLNKKTFLIMKLNAKLLLKAISLLSLAIPLIYASDCGDFEMYNKKKKVYYISQCEDNADGEVIKLYVFH